MSGLLRRLAHSAVNTPQPTVHTMTSLPYHIPALDLLPVGDASPRLPTGKSVDIATPSPPRAAHMERHTLSRATPETTPVTSVVPRPFSSVKTTAIPQPLIPEVQENNDAEPLIQHTETEPGTLPTESNTSFQSESPFTVVQHPIFSAVHQEHARPETIREERRAVPEPLLPSVAISNVSSQPQATMIDRTEVEDQTEVHVHIGRIEVSAVQEVPPKRVPRNVQQTMSLDEYLARRQRSLS